MALCSMAIFDITEKMEVPVSGKRDFTFKAIGYVAKVLNHRVMNIYNSGADIVPCMHVYRTTAGAKRNRGPVRLD